MQVLSCIIDNLFATKDAILQQAIVVVACADLATVWYFVQVCTVSTGVHPQGQPKQIMLFLIDYTLHNLIRL